VAMHEPIPVIMAGCGKFSRYYDVPVLEADPAVAFAGIFDPSPSGEVPELTQRTGAALVGAIEAKIALQIWPVNSFA
jgi:hypothetical protein